jgi:GntR family transcriptional regulator
VDTDPLIARLERLISELLLRAGERLGTERELAERFGVTRTALRVALGKMEAEHRIRRNMGSTGGVFVSDGRIERQLNTIEGVPHMLQQQGVQVHTEVLRFDVGGADAAEGRALAIVPSEENVFRLVRRRDADGVPWSLDTSVIPARLAPALSQHDLSGSLYRVLAEQYGLQPAEADETISTVGASETQAAILGIAPGDTLFEIWRVTRLASGEPLEFAHDFFRGDRTRIHLRRFGASWKGSGLRRNPTPEAARTRRAAAVRTR